MNSLLPHSALRPLLLTPLQGACGPRWLSVKVSVLKAVNAARVAERGLQTDKLAEHFIYHKSAQERNAKKAQADLEQRRHRMRRLLPGSAAAVVGFAALAVAWLAENYPTDVWEEVRKAARNSQLS